MLSAMVIGLGPVIRPDMLLIALGLLVALLLANPVMVGDLANGRIRLFRAVGAFVLLPLLSGVFRVVYFGLLAPNTALAKSAFSPHLIQGSRYLKDFLLPNALWVPAIVSFIILALRLDSWWRRGVRAEVLMISAWALGALADGGYVLWIGGDFMHARMLLPAFFCLAMLVWIDLGNRVERTFPLAILLVWALISGGILRYTQPGIGPDGIANERSYYLAQAQAAHPVDRIDFSQFVGYQQGVLDRRVARSLSAPHGQLIALDVLTSRDVRQMVATRGTRRILAHSHLSERLFIPAYSIGIWGVAAGPDVYLFDQLNLADPVGSHFSDVRYGRPGHSDIISSSWMLARFGTVSDHRFLGESGAALVASERRVMACQPLFGLLGYHHGSLLVGRRPAQPRARGHVDDDAVPVDTEGRLHPALSMTAPHE